MEIMGANTEPIKYRNPSYSVIGVNIASIVPMAQTLIAAGFSLNIPEILSLLTPAE